MKFNYIARTKLGEIQTGTIEALSQEAAVEALQANDLVVLSCVSAKSLPLWIREIKFLQKVKFKETVNFSRQLSILFSAKVPLVTALQALARQQENYYFRDIIFQIANDVEAGLILSKSLAKHPKVFSIFYVNLVKSGEVSGNLENTLNYLADHLERQYYLFSRVRSAMFYPAFILTGFVIVAVLMLTLVIPNLISILEESGQELPFLTRLIIGVSHFIREWGWLILIILLFITVALWRFHQTDSGRKFFDNLKLKLPIFGQIFKKIYLARFTENLSTLVKGGLPILQALQVSAEVVGNAVFTDLILEAKEGVRVGNTISSAFEKHEEMPPMVTQMILTGERTGQLDFVLQKISVFYAQEVDNIVNNLSSLIEPILIILLGIGVAILLTAILLPIYNIAGGF